MSFANVLGHFPKCFHFLGQSISVPPNDKITTLGAPKRFERRHTNALKYIPSGVRPILATLAATTLCIYSTAFGEFTLLSSFSKIANAQLSILLILDLVTAFVVAGQAFFLSSHYSKLYEQVHTIEHLSRKKFSWDLNGLRRSYIRKICVTCAAFSTPYIAIMCTKPINASFIIVITCDFILATFSLVTYFHALFYIQLLNHMLQTFVKYVEFRATTFPTSNVTTIHDRDSNVTRMKLEMYYFKLLHFNLCEFSQTINFLFGWVLLIYLLDHFLYTIYIFFQTAIIFLHPTNFIEITRKLEKELCTLLVCC